MFARAAAAVPESPARSAGRRDKAPNATRHASRDLCSIASISRSRYPPSRLPTSCCPRRRREARKFARAIQSERYAGLGNGTLLEEVASPEPAGLVLLRDATDALSLSACGYHCTLTVARTLADLNGAEQVGRIHIAEALSRRDAVCAPQLPLNHLI
jgi:hypothetical protein